MHQNTDFSVFKYDITDSTNTRAREYATAVKPQAPTLFVAEAQSEGRGRMGRSFFSPPGGGLYMSLLLKQPTSRSRFACLTSLCAVAAAEAVFEVFGAEVKIKWVNDLYLNGKKIAGILAESFNAGDCHYVVIGMGINVCTRVFPEELSEIAGSIVPYSVNAEEKEALARFIVKKLLRMLENEDISLYMDEYRRLSCVIGKNIIFTRGGEKGQGKAVDITPQGSLVVELDGGESIELASGEISVRVISG